jgi:hypothetical protein
MFIGHFGLALAAKKVSPKTSLGTLMMAAGFVDRAAVGDLSGEHLRPAAGQPAGGDSGR